MQTKDFIYYDSAAVLSWLSQHRLLKQTKWRHKRLLLLKEISVNLRQGLRFLVEKQLYRQLLAQVFQHLRLQVKWKKLVLQRYLRSPASQSSEAATASTLVISSVVSSESATVSTSATNSETSNSTVATPAKLTNSTDVSSPTLKVQPKTFIDVSSHNGEISVDDYRALARQGVGGVVVKLTEDTWYNNPKAPSQVRNAQIAGLQVSTYHFSRYTTEEEARAEARFYIQAAQKLNLPKSTVMVNDFEDSKMLYNINRNTQAWVNEMRKHGYNNLMFYTSASWLDENNLGYRGPVSTSQFGIENF